MSNPDLVIPPAGSDQIASDQKPPPEIHERKPQAINWYRTPIEPKTLKSLHKRSDLRGAFQTLFYLGLLVISGTTAFYSGGHWPIPVTVALIFLHGTFYAFMINGVHELGHGTVFKTKALNALFDRILSFLGWINFEYFEASHIRHHRYTLHPPDDLEVVLPTKLMIKHFFLQTFVNPKFAFNTVKETIRIARGKFRGEWELTLFPESNPDRRRPIRWARILLVGHGLILISAFCFKLWLLPVLITFAPFYGSSLFFLCNNTQHIGLQDDVPDFRLCCRTFTLNPFVGFLYWHMNYHTEHHMYAAVPCYNLGRMHELIKYDLPPCPKGLVATWKEIAAIQKRQETDPGYQHVAPLP